MDFFEVCDVPQFENYGDVGKKDFGKMRKKFGACRVRVRVSG
jgi:hypothetical protein